MPCFSRFVERRYLRRPESSPTVFESRKIENIFVTKFFGEKWGILRCF